MKIFQILNTWCYRDITQFYPSFVSAKLDNKSSIIVEAPDYVFEGWGYDPTKQGDARFIRPSIPEGFCYDLKTGTFYDPNNIDPNAHPEPYIEQ